MNFGVINRIFKNWRQVINLKINEASCLDIHEALYKNTERFGYLNSETYFLQILSLVNCLEIKKGFSN